MTPEETAHLAEYLEPSRIAVVATIGRDGMPQLTPNWYVFKDGKIMISTTKERLKHKNLIRDGRMAVCIYTEPVAMNYVTITGPVEIRDDDSIWPDSHLIVERYVPADLVETRMATLRTQNRVIIDLIPERTSYRVYPPSAETRAPGT